MANTKNNQENKQLEEIKKQLENKEKTLQEYTNTLQRLQADFDNYTKKVKKEKEEFEKYASARLAQRLLNIIEEGGIRPIEAQGQKFDPYKHEIIDIKTGNEDEVIIEEIQKGYSMHDKILRTSKVIITKKGEN